MFLTTTSYKKVNGDKISYDDIIARLKETTTDHDYDMEKATYYGIIDDYINTGKLLFCNTKSNINFTEISFSKLWSERKYEQDFRQQCIKTGCPYLADRPNWKENMSIFQIEFSSEEI
jgi:hypothetical protein